ncbi:MAG: hypothetical protein ACF8R7_01305 [Phycisphaerales bacterium JB039]
MPLRRIFVTPGAAPTSGRTTPAAAVASQQIVAAGYTGLMARAWIWALAISTAGLSLAVALWALLWDRANRRQRCPRCWYDLAGARPPVTCPECGRQLTRARDLHRTRRRWGTAVVALVVAVTAGWVAPMWMTRGWIAAIPAPVLDVIFGAVFADRAEELCAEWGLYEWPPGQWPPPPPDGAWRRTLIAWRLARELDATDGAGADAFSIAAAWSVLDAGGPEQRRPIIEAIIRLPRRALRDPQLRPLAFRLLRWAGPDAHRAIEHLWTMAPGVEDRDTYGFIQAICAIDPSFQPGAPLTRAQWYEQALARPLSHDLRIQIAYRAIWYEDDACEQVGRAALDRIGAWQPPSDPPGVDRIGGS